MGFTYLAGPRLACLARVFSFFSSASPPLSPFSGFHCFFEAWSSSTCDVARFRVPWFALALPPVVVVGERVVGMMVVIVEGVGVCGRWDGNGRCGGCVCGGGRGAGVGCEGGCGGQLHRASFCVVVSRFALSCIVEGWWW